MPIPFHWLELRALCHATEDDDRVERALGFLLPEATPESRVTKGHWGNRLAVVTARAVRNADIDAFWRRLRDAGSLDGVVGSLPDRIDKDGILHLRLEKQAAYLGTILRVDTGDSVAVRAKVASRRARRGDFLKAARTYLEGL